METNFQIQLFKHKFSARVRFAEVDSSAVVHNVQYHFWAEHARTEYFREIGIPMHPKTFNSDFPLMVVHSEIDHFATAGFGDEYTILTRTVSVKNSSLLMENLIYSGERLLAKAKCNYVHLSAIDGRPQRISDSLRQLIKDYENDNVTFIE